MSDLLIAAQKALPGLKWAGNNYGVWAETPFGEVRVTAFHHDNHANLWIGDKHVLRAVFATSILEDLRNMMLLALGLNGQAKSILKQKKQSFHPT